MKTLDYLGVALGLIGFGLFWYATSWMPALGLFLAMFGNNIRMYVLIRSNE